MGGWGGEGGLEHAYRVDSKSALRLLVGPLVAEIKPYFVFFYQKAFFYMHYMHKNWLMVIRARKAGKFNMRLLKGLHPNRAEI